MWIIRLTKKCGHWRAMRLLMGVVIGCLAAMLVVRLVTPIGSDPCVSDVLPRIQTNTLGGLSLDPNVSNSIDLNAALGIVRRGLFRSVSPLRDRPIADKVVERIRSQLALRCVLEMNEELVAYIHVKDMGLKRCKVGDSVEGLFKVLNVQPKAVEIAIVDHKVTLTL